MVNQAKVFLLFSKDNNNGFSDLFDISQQHEIYSHNKLNTSFFVMN